jgi:Putative transposase
MDGGEPFGGPQAVLAYLSRYTHRVAISNRRLISAVELRCSHRSVRGEWRSFQSSHLHNFRN